MVFLGPMKGKKGHQCAYETNYHRVFSVKYRKTSLREPVVRAIKEICQGLEERYEFELERIGVMSAMFICCAACIRSMVLVHLHGSTGALPRSSCFRRYRS